LPTAKFYAIERDSVSATAAPLRGPIIAAAFGR
jgi:carbon starvation protein CstA